MGFRQKSALDTGWGVQYTCYQNYHGNNVAPEEYPFVQSTAIDWLVRYLSGSREVGSSAESPASRRAEKVAGKLME